MAASTIKLEPHSPCPCGRPRRLIDCCWRGGALVVPQTETRPKRPSTGYAHARCYASALNDCSTKISAEHVVSAAIQRRIAGSDGMLRMTTYLDGERKREITSSVANLKACVLCKRHNESLSGLDACADRFFEIVAGLTDIMQGEPPREQPAWALNGHDFERWLLKLTCGLMASRREAIETAWLHVLFGYCSMALPWGLHVNARVGDVHGGPKAPPIEFGFVRGDDKVCEGAIVALAGLEFILSMGDRRIARPKDVGATSLPRPNGFTFENPSNGRLFTIALSWQGEACGEGIHLLWSPDPPVQRQ